MTWFKENKFLSLLIILTSVLAAALLAFGISAKGKKDELLSEVEARKSELAQQRAMDPFPNPENVKEKRENLSEVVDAAKELQASMVAYAPESIGNMPVAQFSQLFEKTEAEVKEAFAAAGVDLPNEFALGFEQYKVETPEEIATGKLAYELKAFAWIFKTLAEAGISELNNFVRVELPEESGKVAAPASTRKPPRRKQRSRRKSAQALPAIAEAMAFDLVFSGPEESVREALSKIANSEQYFVAIRALRMTNGAPIPNNRRLELAQSQPKEDEEEDTGGGVSLFDDAPTASSEPEEEDSTAGGRILERVAGGEDITVALRGDLLLFKRDLTFPTVN